MTDTTLATGGPAITQPLSPLPPFAPLPEGALVGNPPHEYQIVQLLTETESRHTYRARSVQPVRVCLNCSYLYNPEGANTCQYCAAALDESTPIHLQATILESNQVDAFLTEAHLVEAGLDTPDLRLPPAVFTRRVGGQQRRYLIETPPPETWLDEAQPPQELPEVLEWGVSLAQALAALHENQVAFGPFAGQRVGLEAGRASLAEFSKCFYPGRENLYQQDIRHLAGFLLYLLTGERQISPDQNLPEAWQQVLLRALQPGDPYPSAAAFGAALDEISAGLRRPVSVDYRIGRSTDVGQVRKLNEDSILTLDLVLNNQSVSRPLGVFAVADGMGGHSAGEVASGTALAAVAHSAVDDLLNLDTSSSPELLFARWVKKAVSAANQAVHDQVQATNNDMGTTLVLALMVGDTVYLANVGDSRAYLVSADAIEQLTVDHSLVERLVATGQITAEEARYHPQRNVIYRTIGDRPEIEPDTWELSMPVGDQLLLCSDGLSGMVTDAEMLAIIRRSASPQAACDALVQAANAAGGADNITAIMVQLVETG
jgi:protein phosphatase